MPTVVVDVARSPEECWQAFTNARLFAAWMPGLRRVTVISEHDDGLPREMLFELSTSLTYTLTYSYDLANREVRWEPRINARDGVRGSVVLEPSVRGTRMTYKLEQGAGRTTGDLLLGGAHAFVEAFVRWVERQ